MILRSRQIIDKQIIFYTPTCYYNKVNLNDYEEVSRKFNIKKIELKQELEGNAKSLGIHLKQEEHNLNYDYLQNIINYDDYKKKCFYIYELINTLKKNLYNDPSFKYFDLRDSTEKREVKVLYNTKYLNWLNYNILNDEEYYKIKINDNKTENELGSYKKTFFFKNYLNYNLYNEEEKKEILNKSHNPIFYDKFMNKNASIKIKFIKDIIKLQLKKKNEKKEIIDKLHNTTDKSNTTSTLKTLSILKIDLMNFKSITLTNKEFKILFEIKNNFKEEYKKQRRILKDIDISLKYISCKNTTSDTAKIEIKQQAEAILDDNKFIRELNEKLTHFYYSTKETKDKEETDKDLKKWIDKIEHLTTEENEKYIKPTKDKDKYFFSKRIQTKGQDGKIQDRKIKFEVFKNNKGFTATKPKINILSEFNNEYIKLLTFKIKREEEEDEEDISELF
jgi:hypothetical protein